MRFSVGKLLTTVGGIVGGFAALAMAVKLKATLTPGVGQVLVYRELFVVSAVLLVIGAIVGRRETARRRMREAAAAKELGGPSEPPIVKVNRGRAREEL